MALPEESLNTTHTLLSSHSGHFQRVLASANGGSFQWAPHDALMREEKCYSGELKFKIQKTAPLYVICTHVQHKYRPRMINKNYVIICSPICCFKIKKYESTKKVSQVVHITCALHLKVF